MKDIWKKKEEEENITRILKGSTTILDDINMSISHLNIELKQTDLGYISNKITKQESKQKDVSTYFRFMQLLLKYIPRDGSISEIKVISDLEMLSNALMDIKNAIENVQELKGDLRIFYDYFLPLNTSKEEEILSILLNPKMEEFWEIQTLFCKIPSSFNGKLCPYPSGIDPIQTMLMDNFLQLITGTNSFKIISGLEVPQVKQNEVFGYKIQIGDLQKQKFQEILELLGFEFSNGYIVPNMHFWRKYQVYDLITIERTTEYPRVQLNFSDQTLYQIYLCQILVKRKFTPELMTWFAIILAWLTFLLHWLSKMSENNLFENLYEEKFFSRMFICRFAKTVALRQFEFKIARLINCGELQIKDQVFDAATSQLNELKTIVAQFITRRPELENIEDNIIDRIEELFLESLFPIATNQNQTIFLRSLKRDCASYFASSKGEAVNTPELIIQIKSYLTKKSQEAENLGYISPSFGSKILKAFTNLRY